MSNETYLGYNTIVTNDEVSGMYGVLVRKNASELSVALAKIDLLMRVLDNLDYCVEFEQVQEKKNGHTGVEAHVQKIRMVTQ